MKRGFTIFFAVLVSSLALGVGLAIYDLISRELVLSQTTTQSQYAIFAADTGVECALYWDNKCTPSVNTSCVCTQKDNSGTCIGGTSFSTSTASNEPSSGVLCNGVDVAATWTVDENVSSAITNFTLPLDVGCVRVQVSKVGDPAQTTIISRGYNTCAPGGIIRIERALQIGY